ncbi:hypothetical protein L9F63_023283, partial [Diploptera punctata]
TCSLIMKSKCALKPYVLSSYHIIEISRFIIGLFRVLKIKVRNIVKNSFFKIPKERMTIKDKLTNFVKEFAYVYILNARLAF